MVDKQDLEYYEVGGSVRDELLGTEPNDRDFVVVGETEERMRDRGFRPIEAESFPIFLDEEGREFALARREHKVGEGYKGFETFTDDVSLEQDLKRRDLSANAVAKNPRDGTIIDPYGGVNDINNQTLRAVSDAFAEDPVRVLRLARFAARFPEFTIEEHTLELAKKIAPELLEVPGERITQEFIKAMKQAEEPSKFFMVVQDTGAFQYIFPAVHTMQHASAGPVEYHEEGDVFTHSCMTVNEMQMIRPNDPEALLAAFFHDIGKVATYEQNRDNHGGHDKEGATLLKLAMEHHFTFSNARQNAIVMTAKEHMRVHELQNMSGAKVVRLVKKLDERKGVSPELLLDIAEADTYGRIPTGTIDRESLESAVEAARHAINTVDAEHAVSKRGKSIEDYSGEAIGNMILQDRAGMVEQHR